MLRRWHAIAVQQFVLGGALSVDGTAVYRKALSGQGVCVLANAR